MNFTKSKFMLFNPTIIHDFIPSYESGDSQIETIEEIKPLGIVISNDLKWKSNTENITKKAFSRLWMISRLKK